MFCSFQRGAGRGVKKWGQKAEFFPVPRDSFLMKLKARFNLFENNIISSSRNAPERGSGGEEGAMFPVYISRYRYHWAASRYSSRFGVGGYRVIYNETFDVGQRRGMPERIRGLTNIVAKRWRSIVRDSSEDNSSIYNRIIKWREKQCTSSDLA